MEVALAATVLAFTLVGMIGVVESGAQMLDLSRKQMMAAQILHSEIDQLRLQSWAVVSGYPAGLTFPSAVQVGFSGTSGNYSTPGNGYPAGPTALTSSNDPALAQWASAYAAAANETDALAINTLNVFKVSRTVACVEPPQSNNNPSAYASTPLLLQVTFTVRWVGATGHSYSRTTTTLVGPNGLSLGYQNP
jgi:hypothetical protein